MPKTRTSPRPDQTLKYQTTMSKKSMIMIMQKTTSIMAKVTTMMTLLLEEMEEVSFVTILPQPTNSVNPDYD
jgi:hypothetical protein